MAWSIAVPGVQLCPTGQGENAYTDRSESNTVFTIPPSSVRSIGDSLLAAHISWKYYGDQWNVYAENAQLGIPEDKYDLIVIMDQWAHSMSSAPPYC